MTGHPPRRDAGRGATEAAIRPTVQPEKIFECVIEP